MKVAVISDFVDPENWGGAAVVAAEQTRSLVGIGHDAVLIAPSDSGASIPDIPHRYWRRTSRIRGLRMLNKRMCDAVRDFDPELLMLHQPMSGWLAQRHFPHIRARYFFHSSWADEAINLGRKGGIRLRAMIEGRVLRRVECVFVTSGFTRQALLRRYSSIVTDVRDNALAVRSPPYGIDSSAALALRKRYDVEDEYRIVAVFRRLIPRTGVDLFLDALVKCENVCGLIGGAGESADALKAQAETLGLSKRVRFLGYIDDHEKIRVLQGADAVAVPSTALEGFGLSTLEAMTCGCPVVVTPVGNNADLIASCRGGIVSGAATSSSFAAALGDCLARQWDRSELAQRAQQAYSWDRHAEVLLKEK